MKSLTNAKLCNFSELALGLSGVMITFRGPSERIVSDAINLSRGSAP